MTRSELTRRAFATASLAAMWSVQATSAQTSTESGEGSVESLQEELYVDRDWDDGRGGQINLSGFTYRDTDQDGEYGLTDVPYLGATVRMVRPDGRAFTRRSNRNGFSNFAASVSSEDAVITIPGEYEFTLIPPRGWHVTSDNQTQHVTVTALPGSIGGLVMDHLPHPFGIAPDLEIRGSWDALTTAFEDDQLIAIGPNGEEHEIQSDGEGFFTIAALPGEWRIQGRRGITDALSVNVSSHPVVVSSVIDSIVAEERFNSVTVGFDDLATGSTLRKVPNGYGGVRWSGLNAISHQFSSGGEGYVNCTQSGEYVAYSSSGHPVVISNEDGFDFVGGYFGIAWPSAEGEIIRAKAYRGDTPIAEDAFSGSSYGAVYFAANYRDITRLELTTDHYWQFVVDDMEFVV